MVNKQLWQYFGVDIRLSGVVETLLDCFWAKDWGKESLNLLSEAIHGIIANDGREKARLRMGVMIYSKCERWSYSA
jgi:hypothetical protein